VQSGELTKSPSNACEKCQGLGKGGTIKKLGQLEVISIRREPLGFSDPYPTSQLALDAAILEIIQTAQRHGGPAEKRRVVAWAKSLIIPKQLRLI